MKFLCLNYRHQWLYTCFILGKLKDNMDTLHGIKFVPAYIVVTQFDYKYVIVWQKDISCPNTSTFIDLGYVWYFMFSLFKFHLEKIIVFKVRKSIYVYRL